MSLRPLWVLPFSLLLLGCAPKIGNKCTLSTDCSQLGDRLCDTTQPDGYCTIFNCEPDNCPDSVCVSFDPSLDPACEGADDGRWPRFERTFCMKPCEDDGDCRDGYECIDLSRSDLQKSRRATVVDVGAADGGLGFSVCMAKATIAAPESNSASIPGVCKPYQGDGGVPWTPYEPDGGAGGSSGAGGGP